MSEMVANKGIIKEIYAYEETLRDKLQALADELEIKLEELVNISGLDDDEAWFNSHYWNNYTVINNRLFDTTDCPDLYDYESDHEDTVTKVGDHEYKLDFYYYNGGTNMEELFAEKVEKADEEYKHPVPTYPFKEVYEFLYNNHKDVLEELEDYLKEQGK